MSGTPLPTSLKTGNGRRVRLTKELARGGEGAVFDVDIDQNVVAKVYHTPPEKPKEDKLRAMTRGVTDRLLSISAWPTATLHADNGAVRGFLMRRIARPKDIHILYDTSTRRRDYSHATYRFLVRVASNVARAFATIHDHGHVIGDVNAGGVRIDADGTVTLVDCDSFQIGPPPMHFPCDVGIPEYQPPELQSIKSFRGLVRTVEYDRFGLAVLMFKTLFFARHPFAGVSQPHLELEDAIEQRRFAYGPGAHARRMKPPPFTLNLDCVSPALAAMFERAFVSTDPRPSASDWANGLDAYERSLRQCAANKAHQHLPTQARCPLCALEQSTRGRLTLFASSRSTSTPPPSPSSPPSPTTLDLNTLLREIMAVERKHQQFYVDPIGDQRRREIVERYQRPPEFIRNQRRATFAWLVFVFGHITSLAVCIFTSPLWFAVSLLCTVVMARLARGRSLTRSQRPPDVKETRARALNLRINDPVADIVREVERTEKEIAELPHRLVENLNARTAQEREQQLADHLDRHTIEDAIHSGRLKGIGPSRLATLVSFGIETAADVDETHLENVHGFGEKLIELLVQWREELERIFTYRPDGRIRRQVEQDMEQKRAKLLTTIDRLRVDISARAQSHQGRVVDAEERALAAELQAQTFAIAEAGNIERFGLAVFVFVVVSVISNWDGLAAVLATQPDVDTRPQEPQSTHVFVSAHDVALRTESGEKLGRLTLNTGCVLLDEHMSARGYRHVRCNDDEGYVHADLLAAQPLTLASALADANTARQRGDLKRALGRVQTAHALAPSSQEAIDLCHTLFWEIEFAALRDTRSRVTHAPVTLPTRCPTTSARCLLAAFQTRWPGTWQALHLDGADFCVATYADSVLTVRCGTRQHASATIEMVTQSPLGRLPPFSDGAITEQPKGVSNDQQ